jgi:PAS domain S-box-containing protein
MGLTDQGTAAAEQPKVALMASILASATECAIIGEDLDGNILFWNEGAKRLYGYEPEEVIEKPAAAILHTTEDASAGRPRQLLMDAIQNGKWEGTLEQLRKNGERFTGRVVVTPRRETQSRVTGFVYICNAISSEWPSNGDLRWTRQFDDAIMNNSRDALAFVTNMLQASAEFSIVGKGLDGTILLWNEGARRLYGYEPEDVVGKANSSILHTPEDVRAGVPEAIMETALRDGRWEGTLQRVRRNGERFTARVAITARRDALGRPAGFLLMSKDVSAEMRLTEELETTKFALERANLAKDFFLTSMSHELRTPLNAIIGYAGTLLMRFPGPLTGDQEKQLKTIQASGVHLLSLINDLLDLTRIESGNLEINLEPTSCQDLIEEVIAALLPLAQAKGLEFRAGLGESVGAIVKTDRRALKQILTYLAENAIKYTDRGSVRVELDKRRYRGQALTAIDIVDTGIGIKPADQPRLFQPFEQAHFGRRAGGSGLGLHLCHRLAALIGVRIEFESECGKGSRFSVLLPET